MFMILEYNGYAIIISSIFTKIFSLIQIIELQLAKDALDTAKYVL